MATAVAALLLSVLTAAMLSVLAQQGERQLLSSQIDAIDGAVRTLLKDRAGRPLDHGVFPLLELQSGRVQLGPYPYEGQTVLHEWRRRGGGWTWLRHFSGSTQILVDDLSLRVLGAAGAVSHAGEESADGVTISRYARLQARGVWLHAPQLSHHRAARVWWLPAAPPTELPSTLPTPDRVPSVRPLPAPRLARVSIAVPGALRCEPPPAEWRTATPIAELHLDQDFRLEIQTSCGAVELSLVP